MSGGTALITHTTSYWCVCADVCFSTTLSHLRTHWAITSHLPALSMQHRVAISHWWIKQSDDGWPVCHLLTSLVHYQTVNKSLLQLVLMCLQLRVRATKVPLCGWVWRCSTHTCLCLFVYTFVSRCLQDCIVLYMSYANACLPFPCISFNLLLLTLGTEYVAEHELFEEYITHSPCYNDLQNDLQLSRTVDGSDFSQVSRRGYLADLKFLIISSEP